MELPSIEGAEVTSGSYPRYKAREAGPPPSVVTLTLSRHSRLTMGGVYTMSRQATTIPRAEQPELAAREDRDEFRRRRTQG